VERTISELFLPSDGTRSWRIGRKKGRARKGKVLVLRQSGDTSL
jgi:hypothetical protein